MNMQNIPVIDVSRLERQSTLRALDEACRNWGFFQAVGHGMDTAVTQRLLSAMAEFFRQPACVKRTVARSADNPWGFYDQELTKNTLDWKEIYDYGPPGPSLDGDPAADAETDDAAVMRPQWPSNLPRFRPAVLDFYEACEALAFRLLGAISMNLGMPESYLSEAFRPRHSSFLRLNFYPICPVPERPTGMQLPKSGHLGINHHTDAGALTLLLQDRQPGLEVFRRGHWHLVAPRPDALVVNIGDIVQVWSNDRYRASLHRVVASADAERFSAPFFFNPAYSTRYAPLPGTIDARHPPRYRPINWGEFRSRRAAGDYADCGEEIQISHYLVKGRR